mgnify:CR=1 FL=1
MSSTILMRGIPFDAQETYNSHTGETEYDRVAYSADVADWFDTMFSTGIVIPGGGTFTTELKVESQSGMHVKINPGRAVINGRLGYIEEAQVLDLDDPSTSNRIDRIVVELNLTERNFYVKVLKGTPSSSPVAVAPTKTDTIYQLVLADVLVTANVSGTANITDQRNNSELCGISNVRVGVYIPPSDSSENIEVSGDASEELGGATTVQEALNNVYQVGDIRVTMRKDLSDKWLECNGDAVTKTDYPDLKTISDNITKFINTYKLTAEKMPLDLNLSDFGFGSETPKNYTNFFLVSAFTYGASGIAIIGAWSNGTSLSEGGSAVVMVYYSNNVTSPIYSLNDLNYVRNIISSKYSHRIKGKWVNNTFVIVNPIGDDLAQKGNLGTVHSKSGNTLSKTTTFIKTPMTLWKNSSYPEEGLRFTAFIDFVYVNGAYKFLYGFNTSDSSYREDLLGISLTSLTTSGNTYSNMTNISSKNSSASLNFMGISGVVGNTLIFFESTTAYYAGFSITMVDMTNFSILVEHYVSPGSITIDTDVYPLLSLNDNELYASILTANQWVRLFKFTPSKAYLLKSSGWTDIDTISDLETEMEDSDYNTSTVPTGGVVDGDTYTFFRGSSGYTIKEPELPSKFNKNWHSNMEKTCTLSGTITNMGLNECYFRLGENLHSISLSRGDSAYGDYQNYDDSVKLPKLTADDVSAYYIKVKK